MRSLKPFRSHRQVLTLVNDIARGCVTKVLPGKKKEPLKEYLDSFPLEQRAQVCAVALDIGDTFYAAVAEPIPEATDKFVYDRFHVMQQVSKAVNQVRKQESAQLARRGDERPKWGRLADEPRGEHPRCNPKHSANMAILNGAVALLTCFTQYSYLK